MCSLTIRDLLGRLDDRFSVLRRSGGDSGRHATLHAAVDWSYRSLDDNERAVFDQMGVFAGGFDLDAATAVCMVGCRASLDVGDVVVSLVDKSMIMADRRQPSLGTGCSKPCANTPSNDSPRAGSKPRYGRLTSSTSTRSPSRSGDRTKSTMARPKPRCSGSGTTFAMRLNGRSTPATSTAPRAWQPTCRWRSTPPTTSTGVGSLQCSKCSEDHRLAAVLYSFAGWWANLLGDHQEALRLAHHGLAVDSSSTFEQILLRVVIGEARVRLGQPAEALAAAQDVIALSPVDRDVRLGLMLACWSAWPGQPELVAGYAGRLAVIARETIDARTGTRPPTPPASSSSSTVTLPPPSPASARHSGPPAVYEAWKARRCRA